MKILCECGLYVADIEKARREHLKSAVHKSRVAASKQVGGWVGGCPNRGGGTILGPWGFPKYGCVGLVIHPPPIVHKYSVLYIMEACAEGMHRIMVLTCSRTMPVFDGQQHVVKPLFNCWQTPTS